MVVFRIAFALTGGVRWQPESRRFGVLRNTECRCFCLSLSSLPNSSHLLTLDQCRAELFTLLWGVQRLSFFGQGTSLGPVFCLFVWPFPIGAHHPSGIVQKMSCSNLNLKWETDVEWRQSVHEGVVRQRWRLKLGIRVSHACCYSGTTTLPNSVTLVQEDSG